MEGRLNDDHPRRIVVQDPKGNVLKQYEDQPVNVTDVTPK